MHITGMLSMPRW